MAQPLIEARQVTKKFGDFEALQGLDLVVEPGGCVGLLGPNGAGKSTFIGALYGVVNRTGGELKVFGLDPATHSREIKRRLGVVPQESALDEGLTVRENMRIFAGFVGVPKAGRDARILSLLELMALQHKADAPIRFLSGGMKRRLAFVRALLSEPELLILDEPTTGLDPAVRHLLWEKVSELRRQGKTILLTTHYMHEAEVLCDRIVVLSKGKLVASGSPEALIAEHTPGYVALFGEQEGMEAKLRSAIAPGWALFGQRKQWCVRSPSLEDLLSLQEKCGEKALQLRPANLEDVFLKLTGEELSTDD
jgi:lipooligosaccharide transport system ATP-binding protein